MLSSRRCDFSSWILSSGKCLARVDHFYLICSTPDYIAPEMNIFGFIKVKIVLSLEVWASIGKLWLRSDLLIALCVCRRSMYALTRWRNLLEPRLRGTELVCFILCG